MSNPKKILLISRRDDRPSYDTAESMFRVLQTTTSSIEYSWCFLEEVAFCFDGKKLQVIDTRNDRDLTAYDGIFLLGWFKFRNHEEVAMGIALYGRAKGIKVLNTEALHNRSHGKLSQYVLSALNDVPTPAFVFVIDHDTLPAVVDRAQLACPIIMKSITGSRGNFNYLLRGTESLQQALTVNSAKAFVAQSFVPNDGDYRLLVMGGKVVLAIHRLAQMHTHLNNTSQGAVARIVDLHTLPGAMLTDAAKVSRLLHREVTGVDMIMHRDSGKYFFLEANNMPQLSTGSFVDEKIAKLAEHFEQWLSSGGSKAEGSRGIF